MHNQQPSWCLDVIALPLGPDWCRIYAHGVGIYARSTRQVACAEPNRYQLVPYHIVHV